MDEFKVALIGITPFVYREGSDPKTVALNTDNEKRLETLARCVEEREVYDKVIDLMCECLEGYDNSIHSEPHWSKKKWRSKVISIVKKEMKEKKK